MSWSKVSVIGRLLKIIRKIVVERFDLFGAVRGCFFGGGNSGGSDGGCGVTPYHGQFGVSLGSACQDDVLRDRGCIQRLDVGSELDNLA